MDASAKLGIDHLVYALSGYNPSAEEVILAFKLYVQEEAKKYEKEFPSEIYAEWYRLYDIPVLKRGKPWHFKHLTVSHIYYPLAQSSGKLLDLLRAIKSKGGQSEQEAVPVSQRDRRPCAQNATRTGFGNGSIISEQGRL